ncbi:ornithine cyclodeaminase [compost metagenome]
MQEVDSDLVARSRMVADDSESVWKEAGDVNIPLDQGLITRQHILLDNMGQLNEQSAKSIVRVNYDSDITMFKCVGMAAQDIAIADVVWRNIQLSDRSQMQTVDIQ